ncbi:MAG: Glyoxalase/bleomycin resistance protein/dioxygenase [Solirubrobacterales bacterium]|jgi:catechol 2,3-dioxygenase|nr:Glyoxalase/bleomycin resistance protein/dioxygenase [Solirubrobacterales bacterium]
MSVIDPSLRIDGVRLAVSDLAASTDFYSRVLGLPLLESDGERSLLGAGGEPALELTALETPAAIPAGSTGLFHVAWLHPSRPALAETVRRIGAARWPFSGASDHAVSEALYLDDPDGLGIEIYVDRPREVWERGPDGRGVRMVTLPLDVEDLLAQSPGAPSATVPGGTGIGHVHLKVADVGRAGDFYRGLGFEDQARLPSAAFVSAGGYHHHVGLNSWQSAGGAAAGEDAPGLRGVLFALDGEQALAELASAAENVGGSQLRDGAVSISDPDGHALSFLAR